MSAAGRPTPMQVAGPSTPPISRRTRSNHLDEDYFNGVPGAPARKLRSQPTHPSDKVHEERRSRARGVARLLKFDHSERQNYKGGKSASCLEDDISRRDPFDEGDDRARSIKRGNESRLLSPFEIEDTRKPSTSTASISHTLKRSYSTSACIDSLMDVATSSTLKSSRPRFTPQPASVSLRITRSSSIARLHHVNMRRAESASLDYRTVGSETCRAPQQSSWPSNTSATTRQPSIHRLGKIISI